MPFVHIRREIEKVYDQFYDILEKSDFSIPTFLAFGAVLQLIGIAYLPSRLSTLPPLLWLGWRFSKSLFESRDVFHSSFTDVARGKYTTRLPESSDGIVLFVLAARLNQSVARNNMASHCSL